MGLRLVVAALLAGAMFASPLGAAADSSLADALFAAGQFDEAAAAYAQTLAGTPNDAAANAGLAAVDLYRNDLTGARQHAQRALDIEPSNARAERVLAEALRRQTDWAQRTTVAGDEAIVPFVVTDPLPVIHVRVNGVRDATFVIDTGAPSAVLDPAFAKDLGLTVTEAGSGVFAGGKTAPIGRARLDSIAMGAATAYAVDATVLPLRETLPIPSLQIDGIIGTGLFERFIATLDYPRARLILRPRSHAASAAFEASAQAEHAAIVSCWLAGDHFVVARAQVNTAPAGLFFFDSGLAGGGLLPTPQLVTDAHLAINTADAGVGQGGGGPVEVIPFIADTIAVDSAIQHTVPGLYTPTGTPFSIFPFTVEGLISHDFLEHYAYTVDFEAMKLVLSTP